MLHPYTQDELVDISVQYRKKPSESLPTWHLCLWDMGEENIVMSGSEMSRHFPDDSPFSPPAIAKCPSHLRESGIG